jgi:opioid growth factor receptor-like protein
LNRSVEIRMSNFVSFYRGEEFDAAGRRIDDIWAWDDVDWEAVHDFIQWLFPTVTRSAFNQLAPKIDAADIAAFRTDVDLRRRVRQSFERFLRFAGLEYREDGQIVERKNFKERAEEMWTYANHNWLRISRILECLRLFRMDAESGAFMRWLESAYKRGVIGSGDAESREQAKTSLTYWRRRDNDT